MARITVEDCLKEVPNRFLLVMVASKRTKQLFKGAQPLIENKAGNRKVVLALREVAAGRIEYEIPVRQTR
jgi:DNA-directed RNA polymerase subunit omega